MTKYRIETLCGDDWEPVNEETFDTELAAYIDLVYFFRQQYTSFLEGHMATMYDLNDWRVAPIEE